MRIILTPEVITYSSKRLILSYGIWVDIVEQCLLLLDHDQCLTLANHTLLLYSCSDSILT